MRRIILVLAVAAMVAVMLAGSAATALAQGATIPSGACVILQETGAIDASPALRIPQGGPMEGQCVVRPPGTTGGP